MQRQVSHYQQNITSSFQFCYLQKPVKKQKLFGCKSKEEIINQGYENALLLVTKAIDRIMIGGDDVTKNDLVISKLLGQNLEKYRSLFPYVSAAIQLSNEDRHRLREILSNSFIQIHNTKILFVELYLQRIQMKAILKKLLVMLRKNTEK